MNRSPLFYPLSRGMDLDAGGAADLQTDVMRFMAIISMCLVAIFALVQSIPLAPVTEPEAAPEPAAPAEARHEPVTAPQTDKIILTRPAAPRPAARPEPVPLEHPKPPAHAAREPAPAAPRDEAVTTDTPVPEEAPPPSPVSDSPDGFTLRFESDAALTRLVEQEVVGLYAISGETATRMSVSADRYSFWSASLPRQFHEMDAGTVPASVLAAYRRRNPADAPPRWAVSLPSGMSETLNQYLHDYDGGAIVIGIDGRLRLEH